MQAASRINLITIIHFASLTGLQRNFLTCKPLQFLALVKKFTRVNNRLNGALWHEATFLVRCLSLFLVSGAQQTEPAACVSSPVLLPQSHPSHLFNAQIICHFTGQKYLMVPHHLQDTLYLPDPPLRCPWFMPPSVSPELLQQPPNWLPAFPLLLPSTLNTAKPSLKNLSVLHPYSAQSFPITPHVTQIKAKSSQRPPRPHRTWPSFLLQAPPSTALQPCFPPKTLEQTDLFQPRASAHYSRSGALSDVNPTPSPASHFILVSPY